MARKILRANIIGALAILAQFVGMLIFLAGLGFLSLGGSPREVPPYGRRSGFDGSGWIGTRFCYPYAQSNEEKISAQQEQQKALNEGIAKNVPSGVTNRTDITVRVQDDSGRSILDARGQREAQKIVLLALKGAQDQGKLAVNVV